MSSRCPLWSVAQRKYGHRTMFHEKSRVVQIRQYLDKYDKYKTWLDGPSLRVKEDAYSILSILNLHCILLEPCNGID